jgi:signal transduction histidine kinase
LPSEPNPSPLRQRLLLLRDAVWPLLFLALAYTSRDPHPLELPLLFSLAALQIVEPRVPYFSTPRGVMWAVLLKLLLTYLLIGFTEGIVSSYYLLLLLPIISAATAFGPGASMLFTGLACGAYLSFILFLDRTRYTIDTDQYRELFLRVVVFALVGYSCNTLAALSREQSRKYRSAAADLVSVNRSLQEAEATIRRSERLAALGQLSAGLAHELRNPLGTIKASAEVLTKNVAVENELSREMAGFISSEVDRTNLIVSRFLDFARPLQLRFTIADLSAVIDRAISQLERGLPRLEVAVYRNYSPEIPPFSFDADLMERVFHNLLLNAVQATPPGGEITVKTRPTGGLVEISIIDRGAGIDEKHLENIFNPFFTTKPDGVGLGLAIVSKIVDEHGGRITVESELGKGSVFRVYLPARTSA